MQKHEGFVPFYWDEAQGKLWLEIPRFGQEFLYYSSLPAGIGSNDIGLDRGQLGGQHIVRFERHGPKVLLMESNHGYRAGSSDEAERRAVRDSFAEAVLWGFKVEAEDGLKVLVDATDFFLRDAHGVAETLQRARQGSFRTDASRSALYLARTRNFPKNTEVEATITLTGGPAGPLLRSVSPSGDAVSVRQHHSFVELPGPGFEPRQLDPRGGFFGRSYLDFATPISEPIRRSHIVRHRLKAGQTITYYLDRGAPEPIRGALLEGARWWSEAFTAAGFPNGFRVEMMPEDADAMDIRYNVIQWVHRSTRGWSYGASVTDPRTGEILKGHVTLGSLRVRQDYLIAEAFLAPYGAGRPDNPAMARMALDRLRQLSAHEVGHTLGLAHNYIASTRDRASVMDYPHPWIQLGSDGTPDFSNAYAKGIGPWDKVAIRWGYSDHPEGVLEEARKQGLLHLTDQDARPEGSAHPKVHLWDSGENAVDELNRFMQVRAKALERFGENNIKPGVPLALLEDVLVPLYLSHRYQVEAAVKSVGGLDYRYALRGDGQTPTAFVTPEEQRRALNALLATLKPNVLTLPENIVGAIPPRPAGFPSTREVFRGRTGLTFDAVAPAEAASNLVLGLLLNPERATRLEQHHARDAKQPSLGEVIDRILTVTWRAPRVPGLGGQVQQAINSMALHHLMALAAGDRASASARAVAHERLSALLAWLKSQPGAEGRFAVAQVEAFEKDRKSLNLIKPQEAPPGMPIGGEMLACDWQ